MGLTKLDRRKRIRNRIRKIIIGTPSFPRLSVYRSNREIYAQIIDDQNGKTIIAASSREKEITNMKLAGKIEIASSVGKRIGELASKAGLLEVKFDRGGYLYHGRVKALAEGARESGLKF
ncbi:MAG: 50S ribosomal protein L18 [Flavobacteriaceae bacterium TMED179]|nr:MAG: 50S ribosomal protein L18 [Flavobacteriaceae bacterium TMED179]|tara:strand:+ start:1969 stop:2328 length:360 start_codon:yes stop_codon:yes gene_type:complete